MSAQECSVSVVIPCFNSREWISETTRSVAAQTYPKQLIELVIVDDGSTDNSAELASSLAKDSGIFSKVLRTENAGPSAARNVGWRNAAGDWIQFLDSDDILAPEKITLQLRAAAGLPSEVAAVFSIWTDLNFDGNSWNPLTENCRPTFPPKTIADLIRSECFLHCGSQIFRRSWLEKVNGFNESHRMIEDVDLLLRISMCGGKFHCSDSTQPLFFYRRRECSLSASDQNAFIEGCVRNALLVENYLRTSSDSITEGDAEVLLHVYGQAARYYFERDRRRFDEIYDLISELDPDFAPEKPAALRFLSHLIGYKRAETLAAAYRKLKRNLKITEHSTARA
jgi:glycosyltransferase involved in cell wall biosynthesis